MAPGLLYVTMQPGKSLSPENFHDWYNNEHGPTRLRLPFVENGFRYRATDVAEGSQDLPEWLAIYDITDMQELQGDQYLRLRRDDVKSAREKATMPQIAIDRRLYDLADSKQAENFSPLENEDEYAAPDSHRALIAITHTVQPGKEDEYNSWYAGEHRTAMSKIAGWLRTRRFITSGKDNLESLVLHEYAPQNGLKGADIAATSNPPAGVSAQAPSHRMYDHYYTFGAAPRDLAPLENASPFTSPDGKTNVLPASTTSPVPAIESYITTPDGVNLPYRLEGSTDPDAPLIVLSNCILTHYSIWDGFVARFFNNPSHRAGYRVLRYLSRGRFGDCADKPDPVTLEVLSSDVMAILDALRVRKATALIGVSLGGATVLNTALKFPERVGSFVACDTNPRAPETNRKAWGERIEMATNEGMADPNTNEPIVGTQLAEVTVKRWFADCEGKNDRAQAVQRMVRDNSLAGFKKGVEALYEYDMRDAMKASAARGAFVVGSADGVLPKTMKEMANGMGPNAQAEYHVIDNAGHLPMVEQPDEFERMIAKFIGGQ